MAKSTHTKLSPAQYQARLHVLADWLERQLSDAKLSDGVIRRQLAIPARTFTRIKPQAQAILDARLKERSSKVLAATTTVAIRESLKGVKTRHERILILQTEIDATIKELNARRSKPIPLMTRATMRRTIRDLQAEISKIEGDYAPEKREIDLNTPTTDDIDYENLTDEELDLIIKIGQKRLKAPQ